MTFKDGHKVPHTMYVSGAVLGTCFPSSWIFVANRFLQETIQAKGREVVTRRCSIKNIYLRNFAKFTRK